MAARRSPERRGRRVRPSRENPAALACGVRPGAMSTLRGGATARGASPVKRAPGAQPPAVFVLDDELANSLLGAPPPPRAPRPDGEAAALGDTAVRAPARRGSRHAPCRALRRAATPPPLTARSCRAAAAPLPPHDCAPRCAARSRCAGVLIRAPAPPRRGHSACKRRVASVAFAAPRPRGRTARPRPTRATWRGGSRWRRRTRSGCGASTPRDARSSCAPPKKTLDRRTPTQTGAFLSMLVLISTSWQGKCLSDACTLISLQRGAGSPRCAFGGAPRGPRRRRRAARC